MHNLPFLLGLYFLAGVSLAFLMDFIIHAFDKQEHSPWLYVVIVVIAWPLLFLAVILHAIFGGDNGDSGSDQG